MSVRLSWAQARLRDAGIDSLVLDHHTSLVEGSIGAIPRRLMVAERDHAARPRHHRRRRGGAALSAPVPAAPTSEDSLLGGRVRLGSRATAPAPRSIRSSSPPRCRPSRRQLVLDIGCGSGAATLCLAARVPQCRVVGLELQPDLARLAGDNVALNGMAARVTMHCRRPAAAAARAGPGSFDHVMANPPFLERGRAQPVAQPGEGRRRDRGRGGSRRLGPLRGENGAAQGEHHLRAPRRPHRRAARPAWRAGPAGSSCSRCGRGGTRCRPRSGARSQAGGGAGASAAGLVLHEADGRFTAAAEAVLRHGEALPL